VARPWFYDDVSFDAARAEAAVDALRRLRAQVNELGDVRARAAYESLAEWRGRFREEFDCDFPVSQGRLAAIEQRIEAAIAEIRLGEQRAIEERARRTALRARHEDELRRAEAREAAMLPATS
jgi:hypothetical protein